ncbi:hypothetical protein [Cohnella sp. GCM10027633]|uniref:hypothetical protein n=1 Tax=unclassified Cohnella TaxID=2636738 RepID=UPI00363E3DE9
MTKVSDYSYGFLSNQIYRKNLTKNEIEIDPFGRMWELVDIIDDNSGYGQLGSGFYAGIYEEVDANKNKLGNIVLAIRGTDDPFDIDITWWDPTSWDNAVPFIEDVIVNDYLGVVRGNATPQLPVALDVID